MLDSWGIFFSSDGFDFTGTIFACYIASGQIYIFFMLADMNSVKPLHKLRSFLANLLPLQDTLLRGAPESYSECADPNPQPVTWKTCGQLAVELYFSFLGNFKE